MDGWNPARRDSTAVPQKHLQAHSWMGPFRYPPDTVQVHHGRSIHRWNHRSRWHRTTVFVPKPVITEVLARSHIPMQMVRWAFAASPLRGCTPKTHSSTLPLGNLMSFPAISHGCCKRQLGASRVILRLPHTMLVATRCHECGTHLRLEQEMACTSESAERALFPGGHDQWILPPPLCP